MRRTFLSVTLSLLLCCLFAACSVIPTAPNAEAPTALPTETPSPTAVPTPTPKPTPSPTATPEPTPTPYDPYTLSDEEAIEMGSYIYDNYIARYIEVEGTFFNYYPYRYEKKDIINMVCLLNQKSPVVYDDLYACQDGDYVWMIDFYEYILQATTIINSNEKKIEHFPYSLFLKEGRPEKKLLKELEDGYDYIANNTVSNEEIYEWFGSALRMAINSEETFKDWNIFNLPMFSYYLKTRYFEISVCRDRFNVYLNSCYIYVPAKYVFENKKDQKLYIDDAFYEISTTNRNTYRFLTDEEYNAYIRCVNKIIEPYILEYDKDNPWVKERENGGN